MTRIAVLLAGAGSSADFVRRAFEAPLAAAGYSLLAVPPVPGPDLVPAAYAALDAAAGPDLRIVGGVSLGAHIAARWAAARSGPAATRPTPAGGPSAGRPTPAGGSAATRLSPAGGPAAGRSGPVRLDGLLLALPAWTGAPGAVAAATGASADLVERLGTAGALAAAGDAVPWIAEELAAAWPSYGGELAASLRAAAAAYGPTPAELGAIGVPAGLVAFTDDPLHPLAVAETWAAALPRAALRTLPLAAAATDRSVLGSTALTALHDA